MIWTLWIIIGALLCGSSVMLGAFAAHALRAAFSAEAMAIFETGVRYQMYHGLALIALGLIATRVENTWLFLAGICLTAGCILFSGSLYALTLTDNRQLGMITPIGGLAFIFGWIFLAVAVLKI